MLALSDRREGVVNSHDASLPLGPFHLQTTVRQVFAFPIAANGRERGSVCFDAAVKALSYTRRTDVGSVRLIHCTLASE